MKPGQSASELVSGQSLFLDVGSMQLLLSLEWGLGSTMQFIMNPDLLA